MENKALLRSAKQFQGMKFYVLRIASTMLTQYAKQENP